MANPLSIKKYNSYKAKYEKTMYHLTSKKNAESIFLDGFNINLSKKGAFGTGINLTTDIINLRPYYSNNKNYIVICKVKYNKRKFNTSGPEMIDKYTTKPKYDFSTINSNRKIYDALYVKRHDIYVIPNANQIYPLAIGKIKFTKDETYKEYAN